MFFSLLSRSVKNDKTKTWSRNEFDREIQGLLNVRLPVSMSKIKSLREVALNHGEHRNYILQSILRFIENAPPDYRTTGLYVINYIIKRAKTRAHEVVASEYRQRFSVVLYEGALDNLFSPCTDEDKIRVMKVLRNWRDKNLYSEKVVERVRKSIMQYIPPNAEDAWRRGSQQDLPCRADSEGRESMSEEAVKYFLAISTASASNAYSFTESLHTLHPLAMPSQSRPNNLHPDINPYYNPPDVAITDPNFQPMDSITPALAHFLFSVSCNNNNIPVRIGSCNAGSSGSETDRARDPSQEAREETEARSTEITDHSESIDAVNRNQAETDLCVKTEPVQLEKEGVYLEKMEGNNEEDKTADIHQQVPLSKNDSIPEAESFTRAMSPASIGTRSMAIDSKPSLSEVMEAVATNAIPPLPKTPPPPPSNAMLSISHQREASNHSQTAVPLSFENSSIAESNAFPVSSKAPRTPPLPASNIPPPTPPPTPKTPPLPPSTPSSSFDPPAPKTPPLPPSIVATNPSSSPTRTCSLPPASVPTSKRMTSSPPAPKTPRLLPQSSVSLDQEKLVSNPPPPKTPPLPPSDNRVTCNNPSLPPTAKTPPLPPVRNQQVANLSRLGTPPLPSGTREEICWPSLPPPPPRTPPLPSNDTVKELAVPAPPKTPPLPPNGAQLLPPPPKTPPLPPAKDEKHTSSAPPPKTPPLPAIGSSHISVPRQSELPPVHSSLKLSSPAPISPEQKQRNSLTECNKSSRRDTRPCDHEQPTKQLNADDTSCYPARHQGDQLDTQQERSSKPSWWDQRPTEYTEQEEAENKNNKKAAADSPSLLRKRQAELPYSHPYHSSKVSRWDQKQS